jgi:hypothetical protein
MTDISSTPVPDAPVSQLLGGAITITLAAAMATAGLLLLRGGLGDTPAQAGIFLLFTVLPVWLSVATIAHAPRLEMKTAAACLAGLAGGALMPLLGLVIGLYAVPVAGLVLAACLAVVVRRLPGAARGWVLSLLLTALVSAILCVTLGPGLRLFLPEAMETGIASSDQYFHGAIMQMIAHFGHVAIGADGLVIQNYHFLFHALAAGQAGAAQADVPLAYTYFSVIAIRLQLVWALYCAGCLLFAADGKTAPAWRLAWAWSAVVLAGGFETENYLVGMAFFAASLPLQLALLRAPTGTDRGTLGALALLCLATFVTATAKASVGYFSAIGLFLLAWRYRSRPAVTACILATLGALALYARSYLIPHETLFTQAPFGVLAQSYIQYFGRSGVLLHYLLPVLLVALFFWRPHIRIAPAVSGGLILEVQLKAAQAENEPLPRWIREGRGPVRLLRLWAQSDILAQYFLLILLGGLFVLFAMPIGDNVWDFSAVLYALALLCLPLGLASTLDIRLTTRPLKWLVALLFCGLTVTTLSLFAFDGPRSLPQGVLALYRTLPGGGTEPPPKQDIMQSLKERGWPLAHLGERIAALPVPRLRAALDRQTAALGGPIAVQVEPGARDVWYFFKGNAPDKWCMYPHLLVPAVTGRVELHSIPPAAIESLCAVPGLVWDGYGKAQDLHRTGNFTPSALCAMARPLGVRGVYRLRSLQDLRRNNLLQCG